LAAVGQGRAEVGGGLSTGQVGDRHGQAPARVDAAGKHSGDRGPAFLPGEEGLDGGSQSVGRASQYVRAAGEYDRHDRRAGLRQGFQELLLTTGKGQVGSVAALTGGASAE